MLTASPQHYAYWGSWRLDSKSDHDVSKFVSVTPHAIFKVNWRQFPPESVATKTSHFSRGSKAISSMFVATKQSISIQTMMFPHPNQVVFVPKRTALAFILTFGSLKNTLFPPTTRGPACALTSDRVCVKEFRFHATSKGYEPGCICGLQKH